MKKIVALLLVLTMLISCSAYASFLPADQQIQAETAGVGLLRALDIVNDSFFEGEYVTRAQFAVMTARLINAPLGASGSRFADVDEEHYGAKEIEALAELKVINGDSDSVFRPDEPISKLEALKIILSALGYNELMTVKGGWTAGVLSVAQSRQIDHKNMETTPDGALTPNGAAYLLVQALGVPVMEITGFGKRIEFSTGDDALKVYFDIEKTEGIIEANGRFSIEGNLDCAPDEIVLSGTTVKTKENISWDFVGMNVDCYIQTYEDGRKTAIYVEPSDNEILTVDAADIDSFDGRQYVYGDNSKKAALAENVDVIYNYSLMTNYNKDRFVPSNGHITLIDNDGKGGYDVVYLFEYTNYIVGQTSTDGKFTYVYDASGNNLKPAAIITDSESQNTLIMNESGKELASPSAIRVNDCVSVFGIETERGLEAAVVIQSKGTVTGTLTKRKVLGTGEVVLTVNGEEYAVSAEFEQKAKNLGMQDGITFMIDYRGRLAGLFPGKKELPMAVGYLIAANISEEAFSDVVLLKVLTEFNKIVVYRGAKEIRMGDEKLGSDAVLSALRNSDGSVQQVFLYRVNEAGEINELVLSTPYDFEGKEDVVLYRLAETPKNLIYYPTLVSGTHSFDGLANIDPSTRIYHVPYNKGDAEDEDYKIIGKESLIVPVEYTVEAFVTSKDSVIADIIVVSQNEKMWRSNPQFGVVTEVSTIMDAEGNTKKSVSVIQKNGTGDYIAAEDFVVEQATMADAGYSNTGVPPEGIETKEVSAGDVIAFQTDIEGKIVFVKIVYKADEKIWTKSGEVGTGVYRRSAYFPANAYKVDGNQNVVFVPMDYISQNKKVDFTKTVTYNLGRFAIVTVDMNNKKEPVTRSAPNDVLTYANAENACSKLVVLTGESLEDMLIIIK